MNPLCKVWLALLGLAAVPASVQAAVTLEQLAIEVPRGVNRQASFTNKQSAYFYTQTGVNDHPEHAWFRGLNIGGRRIFSDLHLSDSGVELNPANARARVSPDALAWTYPGGITGTLRLFDNRNLVELAIVGPVRQPTLRLAGDMLQADGKSGSVDWYTSTNDKDKVDHVGVLRAGASFFIATAESREAAARLLGEAPSHAKEWQEQRRKRLASLVNGDHFLATDDERTTRALRWLTLTTDELVTKQRGEGIYAGLPWFNEYWGRDSFISLPGATLVTGQFETARAILKSFAKFQDLDRASKFYGRVPNIVKPGSLDYHTTDGTPRFILSLRDYVRYSGDRSIVAELYPNIEASIEGSLANWTDAAGYLVHADNETWMDARRNPDLAAYSPRANRANDIQALWHEQLLAGAEFAAMQGDQAAATRWTQAAERIRSHFAADFVEPETGAIADHLDSAGRPDFTLRPNLLFALDMVPANIASRELRRSWQALVFPWGVATLDPKDRFFHPYHFAPDRYPKDEAYHNGTIWPWLDGIAMQRMIEHGQVDLAWPLFNFNIDLALDRGVVGGLPETMDAYPHPGEKEPRLTGTFLQAWSNAEQLRVWYQCILGLRPDIGRGEIVLAPRLPSALGKVEFRARAGSGTISATFDRIDGERRYSYRLDGQAATLALDLPPYPIVKMRASAGDSLNASIDDGRLQVRLTSSGGMLKQEIAVAASAERSRAGSLLDADFKELRFAAPDPKLAGEPDQGEVAARDASRTARNALPLR